MGDTAANDGERGDDSDKRGTWRDDVRQTLSNERSRSRSRRAAAFALRLTAAALIAFLAARLLDVRLPLWVVLTAMVVTQTSLGRSLKATLDYLAGTLVGALWGGLVAILVPPAGETALVASLALALLPLAFAAALEPRAAAAPVTAAIVLLVPQITHLSALGSVIERVKEVTLGGTVGLVVSLVLLPSSAARVVRDQAADALEHMARAAKGLIGGLEKGLDDDAARTLQLGLGQLLGDLAGTAGEAERERRVRLAGPDTGPLLRSLLRLRHDLVIVGRAAGKPLPAAIADGAPSAFGQAASALHAYFGGCAAALRGGRHAPPLDGVDAAVARCAAHVETARKANLLRALASDDVEHLFAVGFALQQMRRDLADLKRCIDEWAS